MAQARLIGGLVGVLAGVAPVGCELNPKFDPDATDGAAASTDGASGSGDESESGSTSTDPGEQLGDVCARLPPAQGNTITITPADAANLNGQISTAAEGTTFLLESGTYALPNGLWIDNAGITLRSVTGNPEDVILDGQRSAGMLIAPVAPNITIAELTLQRSREHLVHTSGGAGVPVTGVTAYRVRLIDPGATAFKINPSSDGQPSDDGIVACSTIELTDSGREELGSECANAGGIAAFGAIGWTVRDNDVTGLWCPEGQARAAIFFGETSAGTRVERNRVRDCAVGIQFGVYETPLERRTVDYPACTDGPYDHYGGFIRDNFISATGTGIAASADGFDSGIGLWQVCDAAVVHNTVASAIGSFSGIEFRFDKTTAKILNNLTTETIRVRDDAGAPVAGNLAEVDLNNFAGPLSGDLHLVPGSIAIDAGVSLGEDASPHDIDGEPRAGQLPDVGADEGSNLRR